MVINHVGSMQIMFCCEIDIDHHHHDIVRKGCCTWHHIVRLVVQPLSCGAETITCHVNLCSKHRIDSMSLMDCRIVHIVLVGVCKKSAAVNSCNERCLGSVGVKLAYVLALVGESQWHGVAVKRQW